MVTVIVPVVADPVVPVLAVVSVTHNHDSAVRGANHPGVPVMMMIVPVAILSIALEGKGGTRQQAQRYD